MLTMLGTMLGIGAFVSILGLTASVRGQVDKRFTALSATEINVEDVGGDNSGDQPVSFPADATARVEALNGVVHAGVVWSVGTDTQKISRSPLGVSAPSDTVDLVAIAPGAIAATHPKMREGRSFDEFHNSRHERVAVLGAVAASALGFSHIDGLSAVFINGIGYPVVGIVGDFSRKPELAAAVLIPWTTALDAYGPPTDGPASMIIETRLGAAPVVASQVAVALRPDAPQLFKVTPPPDPRTLRRTVSGDFDSLFLILAAISLVIGAVGIANTTLVAVLERTGEIGLRRSLGAQRRHIAAQFLAESAALGLFGGLLGSSIGVVVVIGTALLRQWTALLAPWTVVAAPLAGIVVGVVAGLYPALRAAMLQPVEALRR